MRWEGEMFEQNLMAQNINLNIIIQPQCRGWGAFYWIQVYLNEMN